MIKWLRVIVFIIGTSEGFNSLDSVRGKVFNGNIVYRSNNGDRRIMVIIPDCGNVLQLSGDGGSIPPDRPFFSTGGKIK